MTEPIEISDVDNPELERFLSDRLYQFNVQATGIGDGRMLYGAVTDDAGEIIAGIAGHTWGGTCEIVDLWVHESDRGRDIGTSLMHAAEAEARRRGCHQIVLSTHSFQAPGFYEALGFETVGVIADYPRGHAKNYYTKRLAP